MGGARSRAGASRCYGRGAQLGHASYPGRSSGGGPLCRSRGRCRGRRRPPCRRRSTPSTGRPAPTRPASGRCRSARQTAQVTAVTRARPTHSSSFHSFGMPSKPFSDTEKATCRRPATASPGGRSGRRSRAAAPAADDSTSTSEPFANSPLGHEQPARVGHPAPPLTAAAAAPRPCPHRRVDVSVGSSECVTAIVLPSGDQAGENSSPGESVRRTTSVPSLATV